LTSIALSIFDISIRIEACPVAHPLVQTVFGAHKSQGSGPARLNYRLHWRKNRRDFVLETPTHTATTTRRGEALYWLEKHLTIDIQKQRPDLLFLHAAVVSYRERTLLMSGPSGAGKSSLTWGLLHKGYGYMSDELAPVDPATGHVWPYLRAINLKQPLPAPYAPPSGYLETEHALHIPVHLIPSDCERRPRPVTDVLLIEYAGRHRQPRIDSLRHAEALSRLYPNLLNGLAHAQAGLPALSRVVERSHCYHFETGDLNTSCKLLENQLRDFAVS